MTKKKSIWMLVLAICLFVPAMVMLTACGHTHTFNTEKWESDATYHWHEATCGHTEKKGDLAPHSFGEWEEKTPAGYGVKKIEKRTCSVCEFEDTREDSVLAPKTNNITVEQISLTYNGKAQSIDEFVTANNMDNMTIKYEKKVDTTYTELAGAPTDAGTYRYTITIPGTVEWEAGQESDEFEISKYGIKCPNVLVSKLINGKTTTNVLCEIDLSEDGNIDSEEVVNLLFDNGDNSYYGVGRMNISTKKIKVDNSNFKLTSLPSRGIIEWVVADGNDKFGFRVTSVEEASSCYIGTIQHGYVEKGKKLTIIGTNNVGKSINTNVTIQKIEYWNTSDIANQKYVETTIATVKRDEALIESGQVRITFARDDSSEVLPTTVNYVVETQDLGTINQYQKKKTTTELSFDSSEYRIFKLNIDTTNNIQITVTNADACSLEVLNASTGDVFTLTNNKFQLANSTDVLIIVKQSTSKGTHQLTIESIEYTIGA